MPYGFERKLPDGRTLRWVKPRNAEFTEEEKVQIAQQEQWRLHREAHYAKMVEAVYGPARTVK